MPEIECIVCKRVFRRKDIEQKYCSQYCFKIESRKVERPSNDILLMDIKTLGFKGTGRKYSVSDTSIRKWIKC